jgi:hypothetical protein
VLKTGGLMNQLKKLRSSNLSRASRALRNLTWRRNVKNGIYHGSGLKLFLCSGNIRKIPSHLTSDTSIHLKNRWLIAAISTIFYCLF